MFSVNYEYSGHTNSGPHYISTPRLHTKWMWMVTYFHIIWWIFVVKELNIDRYYVTNTLWCEGYDLDRKQLVFLIVGHTSTTVSSLRLRSANPSCLASDRRHFFTFLLGADPSFSVVVIFHTCINCTLSLYQAKRNVSAPKCLEALSIYGLTSTSAAQNGADTLSKWQMHDQQ